jgi:ATP-dependent RNA helicase DDX5/DBP2
MANDFLSNYYQVTVGSLELTANHDIKQIIHVTEDHEKYRLLLQSLREYDDGGRKIVFVETKRGCDQLTRSIKMEGFQAHCIHGDKSQEERDWALREFREGRIAMLIATDVAARGLDIKDIKMVFNFDMPGNIEDYVHRIGRCGRAGNTGIAVSFFTAKAAKCAGELLRILNEAGQVVPPGLDRMVGMGGYGGGGGRYGKGGGGRR